MYDNKSKDDNGVKGDEDMTVINDVKIDVKKSISKSLYEIEQIKNGKLPKQSYEEMIARVRKKINEESQ